MTRTLAYGIAALLAGALTACSATRKSTFGSGPSGSSGDTSGGDSSANAGTGGGGPSTSSGLGGSFTGGVGGGGDTVGCSADLRYVVDSNGGIVEDCWPNQGCDAGMCVEPCQAAADSKGNVSCQFTVATPHFYAGIKPPCFATFVANNWPRAAKLTISRGGQTYQVTQFGRIAQANPNAASWPAIPNAGLPQDQVAVLFLSHDPQSVNATPLTCPIAPAVNQTNGSAVYGNGSNSGIGQAWKITSDTPISMYDILPYGGAKSYLPSAELVIPTTAWGTNYIAVLPKDSAGPPWGQIVASQANTKVEILPSVPLPAAPPVPQAQPNVTTTFNLNAGDYVQWQLTNNNDMTGTVIKADKPVSFTGGNGYICYTSKTSSGGGCDSAHQMIPPISAMGNEYVMPPYADRTPNANESIPYRIVGATAGTTLTYDPAPPPGAPTSVGQGQKVDFEAQGPFTVKSQDNKHPFYLGQIMTGCNNFGGLGDEEYVNILPPAQYLRRYVFFTDPTYPTTNLVFVRVKDTAGFKDVTLDCYGKVGGWKPVGKGGTYEITNVDLIRLGAPNKGCNNGPHHAESEGRFGIMVWGLDNYSSYAYPAGGSVATINDVIVLPIPK